MSKITTKSVTSLGYFIPVYLLIFLQVTNQKFKFFIEQKTTNEKIFIFITENNNKKCYFCLKATLLHSCTSFHISPSGKSKMNSKNKKNVDFKTKNLEKFMKHLFQET